MDLTVYAVGAALNKAPASLIDTGWVGFVAVLIAVGIGFLVWRRIKTVRAKKRLESERVEAILARREEWGEEICQYLLEGQYEVDSRVTRIMAHRSEWGHDTCFDLVRQEVSKGMTIEMMRLSLGEAKTVGRRSTGDAHEPTVGNAEPSENRVLGKIRRMWPDENPHEILAFLNECVGEGQERVHLAILKLSDGHTERLPDLIKLARLDWRDVLAPAEYPERLRLPLAEEKEMSPKALEAISERDRRQYEEWLKN